MQVHPVNVYLISSSQDMFLTLIAYPWGLDSAGLYMWVGFADAEYDTEGTTPK